MSELGSLLAAGVKVDLSSCSWLSGISLPAAGIRSGISLPAAGVRGEISLPAAGVRIGISLPAVGVTVDLSACSWCQSSRISLPAVVKAGFPCLQLVSGVGSLPAAAEVGSPCLQLVKWELPACSWYQN